MRGQLERNFIPVIVGFAPVLFAAMTFAPDGLTDAERAIRLTSSPILIVELVTIALALLQRPDWRRLRPPWIVIAALAILIAVAFGTAFFVAPFRGFAIVRASTWALHLGFGFAVSVLVEKLFDPMNLVWAWLVGFLAFAAVFLVFVLTAWNRPIDWAHDLPTVTNVRDLGIYATAIIGLCMGVMATTPRKGAWIGAFFIGGCAFALVLWTGAREPIIATSAALIVGFIDVRAMRGIKAWGGALLSFAAAALAVAWLPVPARNGAGMGFASVVSATSRSDDAGSGGVEAWQGVIDAIKAHPVFGYGEGRIPRVGHSGAMDPHNLIVRILLDWGVVGFACFAILATWFVARAVREARMNEPYLLAPFLAMIALFNLSMIDTALYYVLPLSIFAGCAGMLAAGWRVPVAEAHGAYFDEDRSSTAERAAAY